MMAIFRFLYDFLKKEELVALGYIRQHHRRNRLIALEAVLTMSIVFGGVAYASQSSKNATATELMRVGAMPMTASEFIEHAHANGGKDYWLGKIDGFDISSDDRQPGVHFVSYVKDGSDSNDLRGREITIVTHNGSINAGGLRQFSAGAEPSTSVTASGLVVQYNSSSMMDEVVSINGNSNKVSIHYLEAQPLDTLMDNAMALQIAK